VRVYYNEFDQFAAKRLRELVKAGQGGVSVARLRNWDFAEQEKAATDGTGPEEGNIPG